MNVGKTIIWNRNDTLLALIVFGVFLWVCFALHGSIEAAPSNVNLGGRDPDTGLLQKIDEESHTPKDTLGLSGSASFPTTAADANTMTPYVLTSGDDGWGPWLPLIGSDDTPFRTGKDTFDINDLLVQSVSTAATGRIQIGWDLTTTAVILENETYTSVMFNPEGIGANVAVGHIDIDTIDIDAGTLVWGRLWVDGENGATASIFVEIHEFDI